MPGILSSLCFNPARSNRSWLRPSRWPKRRMLCVTWLRAAPSAGSSSQSDTALIRGAEYMNKLEEKIALITGGNSGIGLATAKQFANEGAYVFITGRREPELAAAAKEIGRNVSGVPGDVSNLDDLDRLCAQI